MRILTSSQFRCLSSLNSRSYLIILASPMTGRPCHRVVRPRASSESSCRRRESRTPDQPSPLGSRHCLTAGVRYLIWCMIMGWQQMAHVPISDVPTSPAYGAAAATGAWAGQRPGPGHAPVTAVGSLCSVAGYPAPVLILRTQRDLYPSWAAPRPCGVPRVRWLGGGPLGPQASRPAIGTVRRRARWCT
jgi:hypothetical protein